jgi:hypothetical protein
MPLYHYCSNATFLAVAQQRSVRLSALMQSNDSMEGKLAAEAVERLAMREHMSFAELQQVQQSLEYMGELFSGRALCLSEDGDLLSQWRGYAQNGAGFSIGFDEDFLRNLAASTITARGSSLSLLKVVYEPQQHDELVRPVFEALKERVRDEAKSNPSLMQRALESPAEKEQRENRLRIARLEIIAITLRLLPTMYQLKSRGFFEEREWRLLCHAQMNQVNKELYAAREDQIVPFDVASFPNNDDRGISSVFIGPKNRTPTSVVKEFLSAAGFRDVEVRRSVTSYR